MNVSTDDWNEERTIVSCLYRLYGILQDRVEGMAVLDHHGKVLSATGDQELLGRAGLCEGEARKDLVLDLLSSVSRVSMEKPQQLVAKEGHFYYRAPFRMENGSAPWGVLLMVATSCENPSTFAQLSQLAVHCLERELMLTRQLAAEYQKSIRDHLTHCYNRRFLLPYLAELFEKVGQRHHPFSLVLLDVDFFKEYNDVYGHVAGDECLRQIAEQTRKSVIRYGDTVARVGGEEFAVVLPETGPEEAYDTAERIRLAIADRVIPHVRSPIADHVTISAGVTSVMPGQVVSREQVWYQADRALYQAKRNGRNRVCRA